MPTSSVIGQAVLRRHAGAGGVERQLADRDAHAADAEIAEAQDALAVGHHDEAHVLVAASWPAARRSRPLAVIGRYMPRAARKMWSNFWQASPTVGV